MPPQGGKITPLPQAAPAQNPGILSRLAQATRYVITGVDGAWFSPLQPLQPFAPADDPTVVARAFNYRAGFNINIQPRPDEPTIFYQLRWLADNCNVVRLLIETRKDQLDALPFDIKPKDDAAVGGNAAKIKAIQQLLKCPDGENTWHQWLRALLEDMFVIDAATIYRLRNRGGSLDRLELIDGSTISVKIDARGRRPAPPDPAYQQILNGVPADDFDADEMLYMPRVRRTWTVYGYGPVEQIGMTANILINRNVSQLEFFQTGNIPYGTLTMPESLKIQQIEDFMKGLDARLQGNLAERVKMIGIPHGTEYKSIVQPPLVGKEEDWFTRVACFAFSIPPTPFMASMNRATAKTAKDSALEEGLLPIQLWVKRIIDRIIEEDFDAPDLEFTWVDDREQDPLVAMQVDTGYAKAGIKSPNEIRDGLGLNSVDGGDEPMLATATGYVPLPGSSLADEVQQQQSDQAAQSHQNAMELTNASQPPVDNEKKPAPKTPGKKQPVGAKPAAKLDKAVKKKSLRRYPSIVLPLKRPAAN